MLSSSQRSHVFRERHASHTVGSQSGRVAVLSGVLFFSGTGALIFETLWLGLRFAVSFLILLVPTTAMGLTLPVIIEEPLLEETEFSRAIGFLYGSNTLGAMLGAVLGEAYLIGAFGLYGTSVIAGAMLCIAAATALSVARFGAARHAAFKSTDPAAHSKFPLSFDVSYRPPWG